MALHNQISFAVETRHDGGPLVLRPLIDDLELVELVREYESNNRYSPSGAYGGLIPDFFNYGELDKYYLGQFEDEEYWSDLGGIYILGCECGEVGCWPLICRVEVQGDEVVWDRFNQPYRPNWQYESFGPFRFNLVEYQNQISKLADSLNSLQKQ